MPLMPLIVNGRTRIVHVPGDGTSRDLARLKDEQIRLYGITKRRAYREGKQYDTENWDEAKRCGVDPDLERMPEHRRKHAYSVQIGEAVLFLADQLSDGFQLIAKDPQVQACIDQMVAGTDQIRGEDDAPITDDVLADAMTAGDVAVEFRWDSIEGTPYLEFWEAEQVTFDVQRGQIPDMVVRNEVLWVHDERGEERQVAERVEYKLYGNGAGVLECRKDVYWDDEDAAREVEWLGVPFIPWCLLRCDRKGLRQFRGESVITEQCMDAADRYNANEQTAYLIARYNSHANLVVTGEAAGLTIEGDGRVEKDVADVLTFPGGTQATSITLPTDPTMIEHQRVVLADSMYASFGLTRVEPDTLSGLGGLSGYALEILNRKTEGTFKRVRRQWRKDWMGLLNMMLDFVAYHREGVAVDEDLGELSMMDWTGVEPVSVFPNREIEIRMGSGYIVDDVKVRDDFTAKLISRREALRERGFDDEEIEKIMSESEDEAPAEVGMFAAPELKAVAPLDGRIDTNRK